MAIFGLAPRFKRICLILMLLPALLSLLMVGGVIFFHPTLLAVLFGVMLAGFIINGKYLELNEQSLIVRTYFVNGTEVFFKDIDRLEVFRGSLRIVTHSYGVVRLNRLSMFSEYEEFLSEFSLLSKNKIIRKN